MGESRQELLQWLTQLLQMNITKVEQCGTGAPLCQIFDSIFLDVPMSRVKFNVNSEYQYLQNFKVLQNTFTKHGIDRPIPVEALAKCKMQDNLEFLQFSKRYWDQHFPGMEYDPVARRKGSGAPTSAGAPGAPVSASSLKSSSRTSGTTSAARRPAPSNTGAPRTRPGGAATGGGQVNAAVQQENNQLKETVEGLERERDFYFNKLREIEVLIQAEVDQEPEVEQAENSLISRMQAVLYSTEEGFEIPAGEEDGAAPVEMAAEEETF